MRNQQLGFTLIELIAVIVILGILAATAVPRFIDLQGAAREAATNGVASTLGSASALNYAGGVAIGAGLTVPDVRSVTAGNLAAVTSLLDSASGFTITTDGSGTYDLTSCANGVVSNGASNTAVDALGDSWNCTLRDTQDTAATGSFVLHYVP